jgi:NAD(P)-dependent dehydrogenase (short-subunit alcohol dehydrogenase family)
VIDSAAENAVITTHQADVTVLAQVRGALLEIVAAHGKIDFLVYSAGFEPDMDVPLAAYPLISWLKTLDTYLTGFFLCFQEGLKLMGGGGHIAVISSAVTRFTADALPPKIYAGHYAAAKAAVDELVKWGRREAHEREILLSRLAPGAIDTPFHRNAPIHRRPSAFLPAQAVGERIAEALISGTEIDLDLVA